MKISLRTYAIFFALFCAAFIYFSFQRTANTTYVPPKSPVTIEQSLKGIQAKRFDKQGQLVQILSMDSWQHRQGETTSELICPSLKIYQIDGIWHICAEKGESVQTQIHSKIEVLHLSQNVKVKKISKGSNNWELTTQKMTLHPQQSLASTLEPVVITGQGMQIHAKGMTANLKDHTLNLLNDVKSHYVALKN